MPDDRIHVFTRLAKVLQQTANLIPFQTNSKDAQLASVVNELLAVEIPLLREWINVTFPEGTESQDVVDTRGVSSSETIRDPSKVTRSRRPSLPALSLSSSGNSASDIEATSTIHKASALHRVLHRIVKGRQSQNSTGASYSDITEVDAKISALKDSLLHAQREKEKIARISPWIP